MHPLITAYAAVFGLVWGSFCNVLISRIPQSDSLTGRSRCPSCGHQLTAADLIPVLSWIMLGGRCRYCNVRISPRYLLVELLSAATCILLVWTVGINPAVLFLYGFYLTCALVIAFIDFRHMIIPNVVVLPAAAVSLIALLFRLDPAGPTPIRGLAGAAAGTGVFLLLYILTRGAGMGMGDVKWAGFMGLTLGPVQLVPAVLVGSLTALLFAAVALAARSMTASSDADQSEQRFWGLAFFDGKPAIPFGTFLALGFGVMLLFGEAVTALWLG